MKLTIQQVQEVRADLGMEPLKNPNKLGRAKLEAMLEKLLQQVEQVEQAEAEGEARTEKANEVVVEPTESIKELSCRLLCEVDHTNEEGRTVGRPYLDILDDILEQRPGVNTSLNCLRWYAGKIRSHFNGYQQYELPQIRARRAKA